MNVENFLNIAPIIIAILTATAGGVAWLATRDQKQVEMASVLTRTAMDLIDDLRKRLDQLEAENRRLRDHIESLTQDATVMRNEMTKMEQRIKDLVAQIKEVGSRSDWRP